MIPCNECISYATCVNMAKISCSILYKDYMKYNYIENEKRLEEYKEGLKKDGYTISTKYKKINLILLEELTKLGLSVPV